MIQDCIWPRAILCIIPAQRIEDLKGFRFGKFHNPDVVQEISSDGAQSYLDITHTQISAGSPAMIARQVQKKLSAKVRIGLSVNAPLSQYAASQSLAGIPYVIAPWKIGAELGDIKLESLLFIQKDLLQRLQLYGIKDVKQLTGLGRLDISRRFGLRGLRLLDLLNGQDFFSYKSVADIAAKRITEYLVLPPNSSGKKLILRYLKQISFRLASAARTQSKYGKFIQLTIFNRKQRSIDCLLEIDGPVNGEYIINKLAENIPEKNFIKIVLALELKLIDTEHLSGQEELPLKCFG